MPDVPPRRGPLAVPARLAAPPTGPLTALLAVLILASAGLVVPAAAARAAGRGACVAAAHRGDTTRAVENSMRAFREAVRRRADYVEMDVQVTRDGRFVTMHDRTISRTTNGRGRVVGRTWAQLRRTRLDDGQRIPTLSRVLRMLRPTRAKVLLELKWVPYGRFGKLHRLLGRFGRSRVVVNSFSAPVVRRFHRRYPGVPAALDVRRPISVARARWYGGVVLDHRRSPDRWLATLRRARVRTYVWGVNSPAGWAHYRGRVTLVLTNRTAGYDAWRRRHCG